MRLDLFRIQLLTVWKFQTKSLMILQYFHFITQFRVYICIFKSKSKFLVCIRIFSLQLKNRLYFKSESSLRFEYQTNDIKIEAIEMEKQNEVIPSEKQSALLKTLKEKVLQLAPLQDQKKHIKSNLVKKLKETLERKEFFLNQRAVQEKKYKSLNLLVSQLQATFQKQNIEAKSKQLLISDDQQSSFALQNHLIREELIKLNESCKQEQKLYSFLKQSETNKGNLNNFIVRSNHIQNQSQILAKIRSHLATLQNPNLECRRKWNTLSKEKQKNQNDLKIYKIQVQRQKQLLKNLYEQYLEKTNLSKAKIVNFNQTQRQKLLTNYLVEQVSVIQQKRRQVQEENRNLHFYQQQLLEESQNIFLDNKQLNSFFLNENRSEQSHLALKMKTRIQELRDSLAQSQNKNSNYSILNKRSSNLEYLREKLQKATQANHYLELKQRHINDGNFNHLDEKQISEFFTSILNSKDEKIQITKERCSSMHIELKELAIKELLMASQIANMEQALAQNNLEAQFRKKDILKPNVL